MSPFYRAYDVLRQSSAACKALKVLKSGVLKRLASAVQLRLRFGYELRVDVHRGRNARVQHLALHVFGVCACLYYPGRMRSSQATPVDPGQAELARGRLNVPRQNVVVTHRGASLDGLKDEIRRAVRLHDLVMPDGETGFDINRELLESIDAINHTRLNGDRRIARLTFRSIPVTATAALVYG